MIKIGSLRSSIYITLHNYSYYRTDYILYGADLNIGFLMYKTDFNVV